MSGHDAFERILASLHEAMLDDVHWPTTTALIEEACGLTGNALLVPEGPPDDIRVLFVGLYYRGQRRLDLEREYLDVYHPIDERVPRLRQLPDPWAPGRAVPGPRETPPPRSEQYGARPHVVRDVAGSRPPWRRGRSRSACVVNGRLRHTGEGRVGC